MYHCVFTKTNFGKTKTAVLPVQASGTHAAQQAGRNIGSIAQRGQWPTLQGKGWRFAGLALAGVVSNW